MAFCPSDLLRAPETLRLQGRTGERDLERECGTGAGNACEADLAAVDFDQPFHDRQTQSCAPGSAISRRINPVKTVEDVR